MKHLFTLAIISQLLFACNSNSNTEKSIENTESHNFVEKAKPKPKVYRYSNNVYYDEEFETTDFLIRNTVKDLRYVQNLWFDTLFLSFDEKEKITEFIKLDSNRILLETTKNNTAFLYVFDLEGKQLNKKELDLVNNYYYSNYTLHKQKVYCTSWSKSQKDKFWEITPDSLFIKEIVDSKECFHLFRSKNYDLYDKYPSPNDSLTVRMDYNEMFLNNNMYDDEYLLINIHSDSYWADWCFNNVYWHDNSKKFYFDNSGEIACIWEVDLERKTIDKIVPEHFAEFPVYINNAVYYLDRGCIRKTHFVEYGPSRKIRYSSAFDTITKEDLKAENFHISIVESYPDSLLLDNTQSANLAVNANNGVYKVKFLYALNDSIYLLSSAMTLSYSDYKCEEPLPYYSDGRIEFKCTWDDGRTFGEKFKVEDYKLIYDGSYYYKTE